MSDFDPNAVDLSYTDSDIEDINTPPKLAEGNYLFVTRKADCQQADSGHLFIVTRANPLEDPDDMESESKLSVRDAWYLPFRNPNVDGHKAPNTFGICHARLCAIDPEHPRMPRKIKNSKEFEGHDGTRMNRDQADAERKRVTRVTMDRLLEIWKDPSQLIDSVFVGTIKHDGEYANVNRWRSELYDDESYVAAENFLAAKA